MAYNPPTTSATDGDNQNSPSGNYVFDSLALKTDLVLSNLMLYGPGYDGNLTITTTNYTGGPFLNGSLTRDAYFNNLTITGSGTIRVNGNRLFVKGVLDISGATGTAIIVVAGAGGNASGATGGSAGISGTTPTKTVANCANGGIGATGATGAGAAGGAPLVLQFANGGYSSATNTNGKGGNSGATLGGNGGTQTAPSSFNYIGVTTNVSMIGAASTGNNVLYGGVGGGGGGAGAGDGTNTGRGGGGGGAGGGVLYLAAKTINRSSSNTTGCIQANGATGGAGASGSAGNTGGGGGGNGGGGGFVYILYGDLTGTTAIDAISVDGGSGNGGGNGSGTGLGGNGGAGGGSGMIILINTTTGTGTAVGGATPAVAGSAGSGSTGGAGASGVQLRSNL